MHNNNRLLVGNNIRKWRVVKGFKQTTFAKLIGISKATLSKIENNKQEVGIWRLQEIAVCLDVKLAQLLKEPDE
jgi:transcriptional regulator with XRE-family HTH domain